MTYATYYIHTQSLSMNIRDFYKKYETAIKRLKVDAEEFIKTNKNIEKIEFINKKIDITAKTNGYYLKMSNKYPNRINIYEKSSKNVGYIFNSYVIDVKKIFVFSLIELSSIPDELNININFEEPISKNIVPKVGSLYMEELKNKLQSRFIE